VEGSGIGNKLQGLRLKQGGWQDTVLEPRDLGPGNLGGGGERGGTRVFGR
jgi:hypothetical protein